MSYKRVWPPTLNIHWLYHVQLWQQPGDHHQPEIQLDHRYCGRSGIPKLFYCMQGANKEQELNTFYLVPPTLKISSLHLGKATCLTRT